MPMLTVSGDARRRPSAATLGADRARPPRALPSRRSRPGRARTRRRRSGRRGRPACCTASRMRATRRRASSPALCPRASFKVLKSVGVDEEQRELVVALAQARELLVEALVQVAVVVEAGEAVADRLELDTAAAPRRGLEHRRQRAREVGVELLQAGRLDCRQVDAEGADDGAVGRADRGEAADPHAELVGVQGVGLELAALRERRRTGRTAARGRRNARRSSSPSPGVEDGHAARRSTIAKVVRKRTDG